ncbi:MAG: nucleotide exchange factor GrpE [Spiroplasma sp.]|nr:nucleotide exchange factor GrpE [Mycoplasmatales bacterium]
MSKKQNKKKPDEEETIEVTEEIQEEVVEEVVDELTLLKEEIAQFDDKMLRQRAEFDNYKKRTTMDVLNASSRGKIDVVKVVLESLDNFERALNHESNDEQFKAGMQIIYKNLLDKLLALGLSEVDCSGQMDATHHHAIKVEEIEDMEDDTIIEVLQKGYYLDSILVRPAMVKVNKK